MPTTQFLIALLEIIWINILLSGDNAVVIALACRSLPKRQQRWGIVLGTAPAVVIRIVCAVFIVHLMEVPYLKIVGGLLLLWIAVKLLRDEEQAVEPEADATSLWRAVRTIIVADIVMSLDNIVAVAAAAHGDMILLSLGLAISIPLVIFGSTLILGLLTRFPALVMGGAALLGWVAGDLVLGDPALPEPLAAAAGAYSLAVRAGGALLVIAADRALAYRAGRRRRRDQKL